MPSSDALVGLAALSLVLVVLVAAGPTVARPPPKPLCAVCTDQLARSGADHGLSLSPGPSHLSIRAFGNGSSRWTARVAVDADAARALRANDTLRHAVVADARSRAVVDRVVALRSTVRGRTLVVTYRVPRLARPTVGVLLTETFSGRANRAALYGGADEVVLRAPAGYRIANRIDGESIVQNATAVTWSGTRGVGEYAPPVEYTYVAFAPGDAPFPGVRGWLAVALAAGPPLVLDALAVAFVPALLLAGVGLVLDRAVRDRPRSDRGRTVAVAALAGSVLLVAAIAAKLGEGAVPGAPVFALWLAVPTALFFALGYRDAVRAAPLSLAALPVLVALVLHLDGPFGLRLLGEAVAGAVLLGVPAFFVGRALDGAST